MRVKCWVEGVSSMSMVKLENNRTRGPVLANSTDSVSISACRTMPVATKPACFDDPACLSRFVELVYCDRKAQNNSGHSAKYLTQVTLDEHIGGSSAYKEARPEQQSSRVWESQQAKQHGRLCAFAEAAQKIYRGC